MTTPLAYLTFGIYLAVFGLYAWNLYGSKLSAGRAATALLALGLVLHYFVLLGRSRAVHSVPYSDLYGSMSLFAWMLAFTYLLVEAIHRQRSVGPFILPFVLLLYVFALVFAPPGPATPAPARGPLFAFHVTSTILAYSAFALAFVLSVIYLLQSHFLRERRLGTAFWRFPALEALERMSRTSVIVGVLGLAIGICFGSVWAHRIRGSYLSADPKEVVSVLLVAIYIAYLWLGRTTAWRGSRAALLCVVNFLVVLFSYTIVNFFLTGYHRFF